MHSLTFWVIYHSPEWSITQEAISWVCPIIWVISHLIFSIFLTVAHRRIVQSMLQPIVQNQSMRALWHKPCFRFLLFGSSSTEVSKPSIKWRFDACSSSKSLSSFQYKFCAAPSGITCLLWYLEMYHVGII